MLHIKLKNFRKLREFEMLDPAKLSIVVGYNESGKSTLVNSIKFAATGEAFGNKGKDVKKLVSHGEERMSVDVRIGNVLHLRRTTTSGEPLKKIAAELGVETSHLPLMFDAKLCGDGGNKHMKAFLDHVGKGKFSPAAHFANDPSILPQIESAIKAGKVDTRGMIKYCTDQRAASKPPPAPSMPSVKEYTLKDIEELKSQSEIAHANLNSANQELTAATKFSRNLVQLAQYLKEREAYDKAINDNSGKDPLGDRRQHLTSLINVNTGTLTAIHDLIMNAGYPAHANKVLEAQAAVRSAIDSAQQVVDDNPTPSTVPQVPSIPEEARQLWDELNQKVDTLDLSTLNKLAAGAISREEKARASYTSAKSVLDDLDNRLSDANQSFGAWANFRRASDDYDAQVSKSKDDWYRWDRAAKAIDLAEEAHIQETGNEFAKVVTEFSKQILQGREVKIDREEGIFLGPVPIEECSESTKWRIELSVMAAINLALRSPIMIIDGADILDVNNRKSVTQFLLQRIVPRFEHTLLTMTSMFELDKEPGLPADGTDDINKWILEDGQVRKIEKV